MGIDHGRNTKKGILYKGEMDNIHTLSSSDRMGHRFSHIYCGNKRV
jgi:hypothetical protein